jgi:hypothetical protein
VHDIIVPQTEPGVLLLQFFEALELIDLHVAVGNLPTIVGSLRYIYGPSRSATAMPFSASLRMRMIASGGATNCLKIEFWVGCQRFLPCRGWSETKSPAGKEAVTRDGIEDVRSKLVTEGAK